MPMNIDAANVIAISLYPVTKVDKVPDKAFMLQVQATAHK